MSDILVIDDTPFWRETATDALRLRSHNVMTASNGTDALSILKVRSVDLIVLDVDLPQIQGLCLLEQIRRDVRWADLPVIMLTGDMQKEHVLLAKKLGAVDYLLKSRFSPRELLERVDKRLERREPLVPTKKGLLETEIKCVGIERQSSSTSSLLDNATQLMDREECFERARKAMSGRTLPGLVAEVIATASSPRVNLSELSARIGRDALLAARVLQAANSANNVSARGTISTLPEAVRMVGCNAVRNIAASIGILDAMPKPEGDGFDAIRSWQHALCVATLGEQLAPKESKALAYVVGLCHDLGEVLFRTHFGFEYRQVLDAHKRSGQPLHRVELQMLGVTHGELSKEILHCLGLPDAISQPIDQFHQSTRTNGKPINQVARILRLAEAYATGMLLASSKDATVRAFTKDECCDCTEQKNPPRPNDQDLRGEIFALSNIYTKDLSKAASLSDQLMFPQSEKRIFVLRDSAMSTFDPIVAALESLARVSVEGDLPVEREISTFDGIVAIARNENIPGMARSYLKQAANDSTTSSPQTLLVTGKKSDMSPDPNGRFSTAQWPISIGELAVFVNGLGS